MCLKRCSFIEILIELKFLKEIVNLKKKMSCRIFDNIKCLQTDEPYYVIRLAEWTSAARNFNFCTLASIAGVLHTQFITFVNNAYINSSDYSMIS
jgi:hypothetical protein